MKFRAAVLAVLSAVALVALGASLSAEQSASAGTRVTVYNPVAPSGALTATLRATEHLQGRCSGGGAAGRPGGREAVVPLSLEDVADHGPLLCCSATRAALLPGPRPSQTSSRSNASRPLQDR